MKFLFTLSFLLAIVYAYSDMPGNKARPDYNVHISGLHQYKDYTFYYQDYDSVSVLNDNSNIYIRGGFGAPVCGTVWAIHHKDKIFTDTLYFCSGELEQDISIFININQRHLSVIMDSALLKEESVRFTDGPFNTEEDTQSVKNRNIMYLISGLSLLVLLTLVFFVWNKNRKSKIQMPT